MKFAVAGARRKPQRRRFYARTLANTTTASGEALHRTVSKLAREGALTLLAIALYGAALAGIGLAAVEFASRYVFVQPAAERHADWMDGGGALNLRNGQSDQVKNLPVMPAKAGTQ